MIKTIRHHNEFLSGINSVIDELPEKFFKPTLT